MTKDEKAADEWQKQREWITSGKLSKDEASIGFLGGCAHKEERYARLVEWARKSAVLSIEGACLCGEGDKWVVKALSAKDELDEILLELKDEQHFMR